MGVVAAAVLSTLAIPAHASPAGQPGAEPGPAAAPDASTTVTLISGDVVRLDTYPDGSQRASVVQAANPRDGIHTFRSGGDVYVEPASASLLLANGRLDEQLFNVSSLVRQGYDDARRASVPVILSYRGGPAGLAAPAAPAGAHTEAVLRSANAVAATVAKRQAAHFWTDVSGGQAGSPVAAPALRHDIAKVWLDAPVRATLDVSVPQIGAPAAWSRGYDGTGAEIAVLDTGIDASHPDLAGRIDASRDFTGGGDVVDRAGHGTHVASIAAGTGAASGGRYRGVAPGAHLMIGKVLGDDGSGQESWVIDGMEWAAGHGADVVNLSLGGPVSKGDDPMSQALDELSARYGTTFVVAAGNGSLGQPGTFDVTAPGAATAALTVGAVTKRDSVWAGSRNGLMGDAAIKPEIMAPGVSITAARADGTGFGDSPYISMTGTSMASPHVAGSVALLAGQHPEWGPEQIKAALTSTAKPIAGRSAFAVGAGRVDVDRATRQQVYADSGLLDMGYFARPYDPAALHPSRTLTYTNDSDAPVTLNLAATLTTKWGDDAPGILTVTPPVLTIEPGAKASAEVSVDAQSADPGEYSGRVSATGDAGLEIDTAIGFYKQDDTVDVTFRALDRNGQPATARLRIAPYKQADGRYYPDNIYLDAQQTEWTLRLPEGDYNVFGLIGTFDASGRWIESDSIVGDPKLEVHAPNFTVTLDARTAHPLSLQTPRPSTPHALTFDWSRGDPANPIASYDEWYWTQTDGEPTRVYVAPTERVDDAPFSVSTAWDSGVPLLTALLLGPRDSAPLDPVVTVGPLLDGLHRYRIVDAGTAQDLQGIDLHAAVALVQESPGVSYDEQVQAATDAGAAVVALYSAQPGAFYPYASGSVPVISFTQREGDEMRAAALRHGELLLDGTARTPYAYDVTFVEKQQVPGQLAYRADPDGLAEVHANIHTTGAAESGWRMHQSRFAGCGCSTPSVSDYVPATGYTRTEYVTASPDITDFAAWQFRLGFPADVVYPRAGSTYQPGERVSEDWLKAPLAPGVANGTGSLGNQMTSQRFGNRISYAIAGFTDSAGHWTAQLSGSTVRSRLYLGDQLLYSSGYLLRGAANVPADPGTYRLEADVDYDPSVVGLSPHTETAWTFRSAATDGDGLRSVLPLVDVDYVDVADASTGRSALDLANAAPTSEQVVLHLRTAHQTGSAAPGVDAMSVWVSYDDGASWQPVAATDAGNGEFLAAYRHPDRGESVSLRVSASDPAGNAVTQTVIHAYLLTDRG